MADPWDPPGFVFHPSEVMFRPVDPDEPHQALDNVQWDGDALGMLMGKTVFIGVTFHDEDGDQYDKTQFGGTIVAASAEDGVTVRALNGEERRLPPWPGNYRPAPKGIHRARDAGFEMICPDLVCFWRLHELPEDS
jgi:hypothetical protein